MPTSACMKCLCIVFIALLLPAHGIPLKPEGTLSRQSRAVSSSEVLCLLIGKTLDECLHNKKVAELLTRLEETLDRDNGLNGYGGEQSRLSDIGLMQKKSPSPFYSDWKRRR